MKIFRSVTLAAGLLALTTTTFANGKRPGEMSIYDIAAGDPDFAVLTALIDVAGLEDTLTYDGQFTVFAPTNDAFPFATVPDGVAFLTELCADVEGADVFNTLDNILFHHVRDGRRSSGSILAGKGPKSLEMLNGYIWVDDDLSITTGSDGDSSIIEDLADISASNGIIHAIDAVMLPADVCAFPEE